MDSIEFAFCKEEYDSLDYMVIGFLGIRGTAWKLDNVNYLSKCLLSMDKNDTSTIRKGMMEDGG